MITNPLFVSLGKGIYMFLTSGFMAEKSFGNKQFRLLKNYFPLEIGWIFLAMFTPSLFLLEATPHIITPPET